MPDPKLSYVVLYLSETPCAFEKTFPEASGGTYVALAFSDPADFECLVARAAWSIKQKAFPASEEPAGT